MRRLISVALIVVAVLVVGGTVAAQSVQRFSDVPANHPAAEAIEWAAVSGVTVGYGDGTFRPEVPLSKQHAVIFMERFYDDILGAESSPDFTRGDMMMVLHNMSGPTNIEPDDALGDAFDLVTLPPTTSIYGVNLQYDGGVRLILSATQLLGPENRRPSGGWLRLICSTTTGWAWLATFDIGGADAVLPQLYEGLNIRVDGGAWRGLRTTQSQAPGRPPAHDSWEVTDADALMSVIVAGATLEVQVLNNKGAVFDVSELRLFRDFVPDRCRW